MRRWFACYFCLAALRVAAADGDWTRRTEATIDSKFVRRGIERAGASMCPAFSATNEAWSFEAWANVPLAHIGEHESAASIGYTHAFASGARLGAEFTQLQFGDAPVDHPTHTTELTATFSLPAGPGRASAQLTRDTERRANIAELSYAGEYALKSWGAFLNYRFYVGAVDAADVLSKLVSPVRAGDAYTYHGADFTVPYRVGGQTILTAGAHYAGTNGARPFWSPRGASTGGKIWFSLAASYEF